MQSGKNYKRIVVKVGSSILDVQGKEIDSRHLEAVVYQIITLAREGKEVVLVSSGAIACGMFLLGLSRRPQDLSNLQATAAIGQNELMAIYRRLLKDKLCAQILLTWEDFKDEKRKLNVGNTISTLIKKKVLPVINENDTVSTEEIKFGDNDTLSVLVAELVNADLLLILSDVDGLYRGENKEVIKKVREITPDILLASGGTDNPTSSGGMRSKISAIKRLNKEGIPCIIANGKTSEIIIKAVRGDEVGTFFHPV